MSSPYKGAFFCQVYLCVFFFIHALVSCKGVSEVVFADYVGQLLVVSC